MTAPDAGGKDIVARLEDGVAALASDAWDRCAGPINPFLSHAFLAALEASESVGPGTGWQPVPICIDGADGQLAGALPAYLKSHSQGEYVFDHGWADALERAGGQYYPKLQVAVPFSPVPGPRLLIHPEAGFGPDVLAGALVQACQGIGASSVHATFCTEAEWRALGDAGWLQRLGTQFHWINPGYRDFDDFLGALASRKRKALKRERRDVQAAGLTLRTLRGAEITPRHWQAFHRFYRATTD